MAKSKLQKNLSVTAKGILNIDGDKITIEIEDVGDKNLAEALDIFDGKTVAIKCSHDKDMV